ncbi:MAG: VOC family protein [Acidobacteriota bacterium]
MSSNTTNAIGTKPRLLGAIPWLACADLLACFEFFENKLGFAREWSWGEPPTDGGVQRDGVRLYLVQNPELAARAKDAEVTITVEDIDSLYAEHMAGGAPIEMTIRNEPWGSREYHVRDPSGYILRFSGEAN